MLPDRVSNPGPLTYESGALSIALRGPAPVLRVPIIYRYAPGNKTETRLIFHACLDIHKSWTIIKMCDGFAIIIINHFVMCYTCKKQQILINIIYN